MRAMRTLAEYLKKKKRTASDLAATLDVEPSTITRIVKLERRPSPELAKRISDETGVPIMKLLYPQNTTAA